jgi:AraC family transcriptional regulator, exoenzyme S synthesis regulatory protein ExsA
MLNLQDYIAGNPSFRKMAVDDLLFVEYKCPLEEGDLEVWWHNNFFEFVLAGSLTLKTMNGHYTLNAGDCVFAKKGSVIASSHRQETFCELIVFVPDDFIRSVIHRHRLSPATVNEKSDTIIPVAVDDVLQLYFHSLLAYLNQSEPPSEILLRLKFEELIIHLLSGNNFSLQNYFSEVCSTARPSIREIMEANFTSNLSLEEYARLCARSLSAFKEEFKNIFHMPPGKWLQERRLAYSHYLLSNTDRNVDAVCTACGFENVSHFIRIFKNKYGLPPGKFKASV